MRTEAEGSLLQFIDSPESRPGKSELSLTFMTSNSNFYDYLYSSPKSLETDDSDEKVSRHKAAV